MEVENYTLLLIEVEGENATNMILIVSLVWFFIGFVFAYALFVRSEGDKNTLDG